MTDLVSRIRRKIYDWLPTGDHQSAAQALLVQAADEIAFLRARIVELEAAHEDASGAILQAVADERKRCAKIAESWASRSSNMGAVIAREIRAMR
ncbi:MAG: hypothetical protein RJA36_1587 [Pseudomonadota bacterium]|jgi:hypothetical protein